MARLIDGDALINTLQKLFDKREKEQMFTGSRGSCVTWNDAIYHIKSAPTVDAVPVVRGKWVDDKGNRIPWDETNKNCPSHSAYCSVCGEWLTASDEYPSIGNFCPNCGADMRPTSMSGANEEERSYEA